MTTSSTEIRILACGHTRVAATGVPATVGLYCEECDMIRRQAPLPLSPEHQYELTAARWRYARSRLAELRAVTAGLIEQAEQDLADADAALTALQIAPGIPAYTKKGNQ